MLTFDSACWELVNRWHGRAVWVTVTGPASTSVACFAGTLDRMAEVEAGVAGVVLTDDAGVDTAVVALHRWQFVSADVREADGAVTIRQRGDLKFEFEPVPKITPGPELRVVE